MGDLLNLPLPMTEEGDRAAAIAKQCRDEHLLFKLQIAYHLRHGFGGIDWLLDYIASWQEANSRGLLPDWFEWSRQMHAEPI